MNKIAAGPRGGRLDDDDAAAAAADAGTGASQREGRDGVPEAEADHAPVRGSVGAARLRIDKWLWAARFFKTRSLATQAIDLGRVRVGGERIKPAREVTVGERVEVQTGTTRIEVEVRALASMRGPAPVARQLYAETADSMAQREQRAAARVAAPEPAQDLRGRPTKRDARALRRLRGG